MYTHTQLGETPLCTHTHTQLGETPLHFACKLGHVEVVALLLSLPLTNTTIRNRHGQMPADVVCQKASTEDKAKIEALLAGTYTCNYYSVQFVYNGSC